MPSYSFVPGGINEESVVLVNYHKMRLYAKFQFDMSVGSTLLQKKC